MKRWPLLLRSVPHALLAAALVATSPAVWAQSPPPSLLKRAFPANAQRAQMGVVTAHDITLNGKPTRLAPGSRIRTPANALVVSGGLVGQTFVVNYTRDSLGQAHDIWILNAAEAADRRAGSEQMDSTNIISGSTVAE